jgi:GINS complex subunit 4
MDIDDILAELDHPAAPPVPSPFSDLQLLTRAYVSERACPELLAWPAALMDRTTERISQQVFFLPLHTRAEG